METNRALEKGTNLLARVLKNSFYKTMDETNGSQSLSYCPSGKKDEYGLIQVMQGT